MIRYSCVLPALLLCVPMGWAEDGPGPLWTGAALPGAADIPVLVGTSFHVIKPWEPERDGGYRWLHGVALAWHGDRLYASFGHNRGRENTAGEEARGRWSEDGGRTWGPVFTIDPGEGDLAVSHGVFLSRGGELWAFQGAFYGDFERTHTRAYRLAGDNETWESLGVVVDDGFWPMQEPQRLADGNWVMSGIRVAKGYDVTGDLPAVAISRGDDLTAWDQVVIPLAEGVEGVWGESALLADGPRLVNIARWGGEARALAAFSEDHGRTWTPARPSNLAMAGSKPFAGTLSTGERYLVGTTTADGGHRRNPLTIALSEPGSMTFSRVRVIRDAVFSEGPGESHPNAALSYPYAVEHGGKLYVAYSNQGGRSGNNNAAELAVIPLKALRGATPDFRDVRNGTPSTGAP